MDQDFVPFTKDESVQQDIKLMTSTVAPWFGSPDYGTNSLIRLHNEILCFCEYITPSDEEMEVRHDLKAELSSIIKGLFPEATIHIYGSQLTKIITPTSDLDLLILNVPIKESVVACLYSLESAIKTRNIASYLEVNIERSKN